MGLQSNLSDVSSESVLVLATVLVARGVSYLHSLRFTILRILRFYDPTSDVVDRHHHGDDVVGSGLAGLTLMCDQISLNRIFSYPSDGRDGEGCVVCLNRFARGDHVRRLECSHVFHRDCFEGWLGQLNFTCPLCRKPLIAEERVGCTRARVSEDVSTWFAVR